jgi:hypothetical protein
MKRVLLVIILGLKKNFINKSIYKKITYENKKII